MNTQHSTAIRFTTLSLFVLFITHSSFSQIITNLRDTTNRADYIIITPGSYAAEVQTLATFRTDNNGLKSAIVIVDSIYSQYRSYTAKDSAIRDFIRYAVRSWKSPAPKYVLLAGNVNVIPSHKEQGFQFPPDYFEDSIFVDQWFAQDSSAAPKIIVSIGRFPAWNKEQLKTIITKTIGYQTATTAPWMNRAVFVADSIKNEPLVTEESASHAAGLLSTVWNDTTIIPLRTSSPKYVSPAGFRDLWNQGNGILYYVGEADYQRLSTTSYFTSKDAASLTNGGKLPVCLFATGSLFFHRQDTAGLVEALLTSATGGAVATVGGSGAVYYNEMINFTNKVITGLTQNPSITLGASIVQAMNSAPKWEDHRRMTLIGDPALMVRKANTMNAAVQPVTPSDFALYQNYPNPFNPSTTIRFSLPSASFVSLKVYNLIGQEVASLVNDFRASGMHSVQFNAAGLASGMYLYRIQSGQFSQTKKFVFLK